MKKLFSCCLWLVFGYHLALVGVGAGRWAQARYPQYLPWVPLAIADELGPATHGKVLELRQDLPACIATLAEAKLEVRAIPARAAEPQCTIPDAVTLQRLHYRYEPAYVPLSCPLAVSLSLWERHVVQRAAATYLATPVRRILHYGTYNCRPIRNSSRGSLSEHATATAIDIAAFELEDGRRVSVARNYGDDSPEGDFLDEVKRGACKVFGTVLSPDYNAAHADHFHLQQRGGLCR